MTASNWVHIEGKILKETDAAFLIKVDEGEEHWIPKSQISDPDDYKEGDIGTISITEWIAEQKGIEG